MKIDVCPACRSGVAALDGDGAAIMPRWWVVCPCGARGAWQFDRGAAVLAWNAMPRHKDVETLQKVETLARVVVRSVVPPPLDSYAGCASFHIARKPIDELAAVVGLEPGTPRV